MHPALDELLFVDHHVVTQIVETELVVGDIRDITIVCLTSFVGLHGIEYHTDSQSEETVDRTHPFRVTRSQIVVDSDDLHALAFQRIQIGRHRGDKRLAFTCFHLGDTSLMKNDAADQLHLERAQTRRAVGRFTDYRESLRKNIIQSLACCQALLELCRLRAQLLVRLGAHLLLQVLDLIDERHYTLDLALAVAAHDF